MLWVLKRTDGSFEHPKHMFKFMGKKIIKITLIKPYLDLWESDHFGLNLKSLKDILTKQIPKRYVNR